MLWITIMIFKQDFASLYPISDGCWMQCLIVSFASPSANFRSWTNLPRGSSILLSTASLKDDRYSNGSPAKVWISTYGADCCRNKPRNILLISPLVSLGSEALLAWAYVVQSVLSHDFFKDDLMVMPFQSIWFICCPFIWWLTFLLLQYLLMNTHSYLCVWSSLLSLKFFVSCHLILNKGIILHSCIYLWPCFCFS